MNIPWEMIFEMIEKLIAMCFDDEAAFVAAARSPTRRQQRIVARAAEAEVLKAAPSRREGRQCWKENGSAIIDEIWSEAGALSDVEATNYYAACKGCSDDG